MNERFYLLQIRLLEIEPEIWRRFAVPASISLDRLHDVIQIVMGWTDSHLHEFQICTQKGDGMMDPRKKNRDRLSDLCYKIFTNFEQHPPRLCWFRPETRTPVGYF